MEHGRKQHHFGDERCLYSAIEQCQEIEPVKNLVERGADISELCCAWDYWTPLTLAAHLGKTYVVKYLLDCIRQEQENTEHQWRPSVESVNGFGETALFCAARQDHTEVCRVLLSEGVDVNAQKPNSKQTALMVAICLEHEDTVETLLDWSADVQLSDNRGNTPLYAAVENNRGDLVQLLIKAGCDVNIGCRDHCPLFLAARNNYLDIVKILCDAGCCKNILSYRNGMTPLYKAAFRDNNSILQYLIQRGGDLHQCDAHGNTPLQAATSMGNVKGVELLLKAGALLNWRNIQGMCAVQMAIEGNKPDVLEFYLSYGVDVTNIPTVSLPNIRNESSLELAFTCAHTKLLVVLLRGCTQLGTFTTHAPHNTLEICRRHPIVLELFFAGGLSHPPYKLLKYRFVRRWLADFKATPRSLKSWARSSVRASLGNTILHDAPKLDLPVSLIDYIMFTEAVLELY